MRKYFIFLTSLIVVSCGETETINHALSENRQSCISKIDVIEDSFRYSFDTCIGSLNNSTLSLSFRSRSNLNIPYDLNILINTDTVNVKSQMNYAITDSSFRPTKLNLISKEIIFDNDPFKKGTFASGLIDLKFSAYHTWIESFTDTIIMKGLFQAYIE